MTATPGSSEDLWAMLEALIEDDPQKRFQNFVARNPTKGWIIASDYVIDDPTRPNDCLCFTIYPIDEQAPLAHWAEIAAAIPRDLKKTNLIDEHTIACLRDSRRLSLCFIVTKERNPNVNRELAKLAIDGNLAIMRQWQDSEKHTDLIKRMQRLRRRADSQSFKAYLFADMFLVMNIVTVISYLITKFMTPRIIGWFSDRDSIISAYDKIANDLYLINYSAICQQRRVHHRDVQISFGNPLPDHRSPKQSWYDALIRIPDYLAGTLAPFTYREGTFVGGQEKVLDMITKVLRDAPNLLIMALERNGDRIMPVYVSIT
ncbi:MAG: hypothetical protein JO007_00265 [Alphaproteobacteria bacterium]|nr:hypothetical protein [Alphaproteobacteria bacterium]